MSVLYVFPTGSELSDRLREFDSAPWLVKNVYPLIVDQFAATTLSNRGIQLTWAVVHDILGRQKGEDYRTVAIYNTEFKDDLEQYLWDIAKGLLDADDEPDTTTRILPELDPDDPNYIPF